VTTDNTKFRLRPDVQFSVTSSKRGIQYVAQDGNRDKFWRFGSLEYELCAAFDESRTFSDAFLNAKQHSNRLAAADPEKVRKVLAGLINSGLVEKIADNPIEGFAPDSEEGRPVAPAAPKLFDPSFFRIKLTNGETLDKWVRPLKGLISIPAAVVAIVLWVVAISHAIANASSLTKLSVGLFVPGSQWWLLLAWLLLKCVHELGHAVACARFGAKAESAGLGFMFFTPSPFVNAPSVWQIENRWSRILISASGILFEVTFASLAVIGACWFESAALRFLCISIVTLGTISTVAFNGNPLMRFDGYYIMTDLIGRPNLWQDAQAAVKKLLFRTLYECPPSHSSALVVLSYGIASWCSRMLMLTTLAWGLWVAWDGIGIVVVLAFAALWFVMPHVLRRMSGTTFGPKPSVAWIVTQLSWRKCLRASLMMIGIGLLGLLPSPFQIYWPGTVDFVEPIELRVESPGLVVEVLRHDGQGVRTGDEILRMKNPDLTFECDNAKLLVESSEEKCHALRAQRKESELQAEEANLASLRFKYESLNAKLAALTVHSPRDGVLMIRSSHNLVGNFLKEGVSIGYVVEPDQLEIHASLPQDKWDVISRSHGTAANVTLSNGEAWLGEVVQVLPRSSDTVEFPSMGGIFGGPLPVVQSKSADGKEEYKTEKPRLHARIALKPHSFQRSLWTREYRPSLPSPGILCSVKLSDHSENIWQTVIRWAYAAIHVQFKAA
jgi:putative peptide zinc metalloprotease protein